MIFSVVDQSRRTIRLTKERLSHILERPEMAGQEDRTRETIALPDVVKVSRHDPAALCYYRWYEATPVTRKYLLCVVKVRDLDGFVITAFYTDKMKEGKVAWQR